MNKALWDMFKATDPFQDVPWKKAVFVQKHDLVWFGQLCLDVLSVHNVVAMIRCLIPTPRSRISFCCVVLSTHLHQTLDISTHLHQTLDKTTFMSHTGAWMSKGISIE